MAAARDIPAHLRELVVIQAYDEYTAEDHAVWRFVVQHTRRRLLTTAHAAYREGFEAAGISADRIPRIPEMSEKLAAIGWSAVCVDGFIPPRAFQDFQAHRILPIAADIRTRRHLTYTPAPDIIHEAAGHAPFLNEPSYAEYLMKIGEVGGRAFSTPADHAIYEAIFTLSEVKEDPASTADQVARAERMLEAAIAEQGPPSEAARLARLYWWTVEYGLIGELARPKLYGAGLLSSIGEGYFCEDPAVLKLPLSEACADVAYDITRPQPQLFVARDFAHLNEVLERVASTLSQRRGGVHGLREAIRSEEPATIELDTGEELSGVVRAVHADGEHARAVELDGGRTRSLAGTRVVSVRAGRSARSSIPPRPLSTRVPRPRTRGAAERAMVQMFEEAHALFHARAGTRAADAVERMVRTLDAHYEDEWLIRYELLAGLVRAGEPGEAGQGPQDTAALAHKLAHKLARDLERLELRYARREPIATGLAYLRGQLAPQLAPDDASRARSSAPPPENA